MDTHGLYVALFVEAFVSIHMSVFVLKPLSKMISKENSKRTFWIMFVIRAIILLFYDFRGDYWIFKVDFFAVFIGAFLIVPLVSFITKTPINRRSNQVIENNENYYNGKHINGKYNNGNYNNFDGYNYNDNFDSNDRYNFDNPDRYNYDSLDRRDYSDNSEGYYINSDSFKQKCEKCGKESDTTFSYCPYCGAFLTGEISQDT